MSTNKGKGAGATILAGPGLIRQPSAVAERLDDKLSGMVAALEEIANCPTPEAGPGLSSNFDLPEGLNPGARLLRFCDALREMSGPLLFDLAKTYVDVVRTQRLSPDAHINLFEQRTTALIDYFVELAQVHGVAFATREGPLSPDFVEQTLAGLRGSLDEDRDGARLAALNVH
ncbi:hypothetical protein GCM10007972_00670 [Iodidimonas muriae]|uniref:Uncharacterized protein n=1 Tax=Iodidimonas muriae TaxID=261467 RepID=A0ABQ2L5S8_9PROT|nr:hypothetical protein [Iodidimonas muriae]GER06336.1 hypothetical protein JCM17843_06460 [Kordiimonadales bacterium JCM 17843]GGO04367.1 hypothetical protein GCM10007972_00670 [Iodidimonas muriae]